jgi:hypothetical protein
MSTVRGRDRVRMLLTTGVLAAVCTSVLPAPALGQAPTTGLEGRVDARTLELVGPALEAAARDSLPVETIRAKVLEGAAKNRPPELIAQVATQLASDLRATRSALRGQLPDAQISGGSWWPRPSPSSRAFRSAPWSSCGHREPEARPSRSR